jgi:NADH:ubiquinone oxidoreductase subunit
MNSLGTLLFTWRHGELVGRDEHGNRYYRYKRAGDAKHAKRWVVYKGPIEASRVPPEWHAWLHRYVDEPPSGPRRRHPWEKEHIPNPTGTAAAYRPPGHELRGGRRDRATGDYEPWTPD